MRSLEKASKMAGMAFKNGIRLHKDAILLYKNGSYPSSLQLSILAQEEIGKAFLLEEHVHQMSGRTEDINTEDEELMLKALISHKVKQGWFSRVVGDYFKYRGNKVPKFWKEVMTGVLDEKKQNATYVGLTKQGRKSNINGRLIEPLTRVKIAEVKQYITRVNDYIIILIEECRRELSIVDTEEVNDNLTLELSKELSILWPYTTKETKKRLIEIRKHKLQNNMYLIPED